MKFVPRPYQRIMIDFLKAHQRCNLHAGMGVGKTATVLTWLVETGLDLTDKTLIVGPLRVARDVWPAEVSKWDHLTGLRIVPIIGTQREREAALRERAPIYTINYDQLLWLNETVGHAWPFTIVVADESTRLKGFRAKQDGRRAPGDMKFKVLGTRSRALGRHAHNSVKYWVNLTGTPVPNGYLDLWGQQWFVDGGRSLGTSFTAYRNRFFHKPAWQKSPHAKPLLNEGAQALIDAQIAPSTLSIRAKDWFDLREPVVVSIDVVLPEAAVKHYRTMEREMYVELRDGLVTAGSAAVKSGKLLQLANGAIYHEDGTWTVVHDAKIEALRSIVEEVGAPLLVAYQFRSDLARLQKAFPYARVLDRADKTAEADWNAGKVDMLLAHPKSAGHGLNLQHGGHHLVYFGQDWNLEDFEQIAERIGPTRQMQSGYDRNVFVYHLLARGTLDAGVKEARENKLTVMSALLKAMRKGVDATI